MIRFFIIRFKKFDPLNYVKKKYEISMSHLKLIGREKLIMTRYQKQTTLKRKQVHNKLQRKKNSVLIQFKRLYDNLYHHIMINLVYSCTAYKNKCIEQKY